MDGERDLDDVVSEAAQPQARLAGGEADPDAVTVVESDMQVRIAGIDDRLERLGRRLDDVDEGIARRSAQAGAPVSWRRLPEFNLCPPVMQLTIDDEIALLQTTIQTRLERDR